MSGQVREKRVSESKASIAKAQKLRDWRRGQGAETGVLWYLRLRGWRLVARNWRSPAGEIDLILRRGAVLAFVEVKLRSHSNLGRNNLAEVVSPRQRRRIERAAEDFAGRFSCTQGDNPLALRFDIALVESAGVLWRVRYQADAWRSGE